MQKQLQGTFQSLHGKTGFLSKMQTFVARDDHQKTAQNFNFRFGQSDGLTDGVEAREPVAMFGSTARIPGISPSESVEGATIRVI